MIIRKPYALLIKYFKLIHAFLLVMMLYLTYRTNLISRFFAEYITRGSIVVGQELTDSLFLPLMYISVILIITWLIIVLVLMIIKKKPVKYYIFSILVYTVVFIILNVENSIVATMEIKVVGARTIRAMSDIALIATIIQFVTAVFTFIRATGFDIKQFDFERDLQELNITEADREEIEVGINIDSGKYKRNFKRKLRKIKYFYVENKLLIYIFIVTAVLVTGFIVYSKTDIAKKSYNEGENIYVNGLGLNIEESYITKYKYKDSNIDVYKYLLIVRLKIRNASNKKVSFEKARAEITINNHIYYPTNKYNNKISDFGIIYENQEITANDNYYVLCYEIPSNYLKRRMFFSYVYDVGFENIGYDRIKLEPVNLIENEKVNSYNLNEKINTEGSIANNTIFMLRSYDIKKEYAVAYNYCPIPNECYKSIEYVKPDVLENPENMVLKLGVLFANNNLYINKQYGDVFKFLSHFGYLEYKVNGVDKKYLFKNMILIPKKSSSQDDVYIQVPKDLSHATSIKFYIEIANNKHEYILK